MKSFIPLLFALLISTGMAVGYPPTEKQYYETSIQISGVEYQAVEFFFEAAVSQDFEAGANLILITPIDALKSPNRTIGNLKPCAGFNVNNKAPPKYLYS